MNVFRRLTCGGQRTALTVHDAATGRSSYPAAQLAEMAERGSAALAGRGVGRGDCVAVRMGRGLAQTTAFLALMRLGATCVPLFASLGSEAVSTRLSQARVGVVLDSESEWLQDAASSVRSGGDEAVFGAKDALAILFTSGTTGTPKGVPFVPAALPSTEAYMRQGLDVRDDDVFCNLADPCWAYGLYYNLIGPLLCGVGVHHVVSLSGTFDAHRTMDMLESERVTNLAGAPAAFAALAHVPPRPLSALRCVSSAGEPASERVRQFWREKYVGLRQHYGQTEHGMLVGDWQRGGSDSDDSSLGTPLSGYNVELHGEQLHIRTDSPLFWFTGYLGHSQPSGATVATGDAMQQAPDGTFRFVGRTDDVLKASGYRIGPQEVEDAVMQLPGVREAAAVQMAVEERGSVVAVVVVGHTTLDEVQQQVRRTVGAHAVPRRLVLRSEPLPRTASGKLQRKLLIV